MTAKHERYPRILHVLAGEPITARRAARSIILGTLVITFACGALIRLLDSSDYPTLGKAMWWAVQTVTTVGYGDVVPTTVVGRSIAAFLMIGGIALLSVLTATVTAAFVEGARRRFGDDRLSQLQTAVAELDAKLDRIESRLNER